jgi:hypothetical protein
MSYRPRQLLGDAKIECKNKSGLLQIGLACTGKSKCEAYWLYDFANGRPEIRLVAQPSRHP